MDENRWQELLQKPIKVPQVVLEKKKEAYERIQASLAESGAVEKKTTLEKGVGARVKKWYLVAAAAALLIGGAVWAAESGWGRFFTDMMNLTPEQETYLEEEGFASMPEASANCNGVTVSVKNAITDRYHTVIVLEVEGFDLPEGETPCFFENYIKVNGNEEEMRSEGAYFTDGRRGEGMGEAYLSGTADEDFPLSENGETGKDADYLLQGNKLEYVIQLETKTPGSLIGADIELQLKNLGILSEKMGHDEEAMEIAYPDSFDASLFPHICQGEWNLSFPLAGSDEFLKAEVIMPYDDLGYRIEELEISPLSLSFEYELADHYWRNIVPLGVRMKDGTVVKIQGGSETGTEESDKVVKQRIYLYEMIEPSEVEALLVVDNRSLADTEKQYIELTVKPEE